MHLLEDNHEILFGYGFNITGHKPVVIFLKQFKCLFLLSQTLESHSHKNLYDIQEITLQYRFAQGILSAKIF
jgi:hypothetical protein